MNTNKHINKSFDEELKNLSKKIERMGQDVCTNLSKAIDLLHEPDSEQSKQEARSDKLIDAHFDKIFEHTHRIMALWAPTAIDLRFLISALKVSSYFERIGDYIKHLNNSSYRIEMFAELKPIIEKSIIGMLNDVLSMVQKTVEAYVNRDAFLANEVISMDDTIDNRFVSIFRKILTAIDENPEISASAIRLLFIIKNAERMGDYAMLISQQVGFINQGRYTQ